VTRRAQAENPNADSELGRTQQPKQPPSDFVWEEDIFRHIGYGSVNMANALLKLAPAQKILFKKAVYDFSAKGDYAVSGIIKIFFAVNRSLKRFHSGISWVAEALEITSIANQIAAIRSFFVFWKARDPSAISDEALQLFMKSQVRKSQSRNVLSDDPEKSWLSDEEYEALLASVWSNYENGIFSTARTLMILLSMQYARRPVQISHLKIKDFRNALTGDSSGMDGLVVSFPGAKDLGAETGFRDSKFEHHPLPIHLWNLFEILRSEIRAMFNFQLGVRLSDYELEQLPAFTSQQRIKTAVSVLTSHYRVSWRTNLDHQLFHMNSYKISNVITWQPNGHRDIETPVSHRTGKPMVVTATRLRHTRARQLARKGVPMQVLSHWLGHTHEASLKAYYSDPAEDARKLDEAMGPALAPLAMAFAGKLIDNADQATRSKDPTSLLEFAKEGELKNVGGCGKHSFCAITSVPIPCYRCRHFEPLVSAPHHEILEALNIRQEEENLALRIGGARNLLVPIDLSADIIAVQNCIDRCNARKIELGIA
jgi:integrase